jgi:hypothetical protein
MGKVGVLDGQFWQWRRLSGTKGFVEYREFPDEYPIRPRIGDNVVHRQQEYML